MRIQKQLFQGIREPVKYPLISFGGKRTLFSSLALVILLYTSLASLWSSICPQHPITSLWLLLYPLTTRPSFNSSPPCSLSIHSVSPTSAVCGGSLTCQAFCRIWSTVANKTAYKPERGSLNLSLYESHKTVLKN